MVVPGLRGMGGLGERAAMIRPRVAILLLVGAQALWGCFAPGEPAPGVPHPAPGTDRAASLTRSSLRACSTTSWPAASSLRAVSAPMPSAEPVTKILPTAAPSGTA